MTLLVERLVGEETCAERLLDGVVGGLRRLVMAVCIRLGQGATLLGLMAGALILGRSFMRAIPDGRYVRRHRPRVGHGTSVFVRVRLERLIGGEAGDFVVGIANRLVTKRLRRFGVVRRVARRFLGAGNHLRQMGGVDRLRRQL